MSRFMFVYLSGSEKGKTRIFFQDHVSIGASDECDLKLVAEEGGTLPNHVLAQIYDDDGAFHLVPNIELDELEIQVNGEEVALTASAAGHEIHDGDTLQFGHGLSSASVLFQVMPENFATTDLVRRNNRAIAQPQSAQPVHPLTATLFVKELTASLWAEIPRKAKITTLIGFAFASVAVLGLLYFFVLTLHRNTSEIERMREQMAEAEKEHRDSQGKIQQYQRELEQLREKDEQNRSFAQRITEQYSPGVCLIVGTYTFVEAGTGKTLRYEAADDENESPIDQNGNLLASVDGQGEPVRIDYTGTGFIIDKGVIATNKHVVRPWATDTIAQIIMQQSVKLRPRLNTLMAFFPSLQTPFVLKEVGNSPRYDVALCSFDQGDSALPVLPMTQEASQAMVGQPLVLLGYPTGVDGLLQRIDERERQDILRANSASPEAIAEGLAAKGYIRPLTTTGTISDMLPGRIVHSAQTIEGGSGSPMFDRDGKVIGINSAILATMDGSQSFGGSNFGVPIKTAYELLAAYNQNEATKKQSAQ